MHPIWELGLFNKLDRLTAECTVCKVKEGGAEIPKKLKLSNGSVKGLIAHLPLHPVHKQEYDELMNTAEVEQGPMDDHVKPKGSLACCVPFQSVNHHTFRVLISSSDKKMKLKDESHYRNSVPFFSFVSSTFTFIAVDFRPPLIPLLRNDFAVPRLNRMHSVLAILRILCNKRFASSDKRVVIGDYKIVSCPVNQTGFSVLSCLQDRISPILS